MPKEIIEKVKEAKEQYEQFTGLIEKITNENTEEEVKPTLLDKIKRILDKIKATIDTIKNPTNVVDNLIVEELATQAAEKDIKKLRKRL